MTARDTRVPTMAYALLRSLEIASRGTLVLVVSIAPSMGIGLTGCGGDDGATEGAATDTEVQDSASGEGGSSSSDGTSGGATSSDPAGDPETAGSSGSGGDESPEPEPIPEFSPGCGMPFSDEWLLPYTVEWGESAIRATVEASGVQREFLLELPETIDPDHPYPILFTFHGYGASMDNAFGQNVIDHWPDVIAVYPQALPNAGGTNAWSFNPTGQDVSFMIAMLNEIGNRMCIDMSRVLVQGTSNGGQMANFIACARADIIDGLAVAASSFPLATDQCTGSVPAFVLHGRNDMTVGFGAGERVRDAWLEINGCEGAGDAIDRGCTEWSSAACESGDPVVWCPHDGGHDLPSVAGFLDEVYAFLKAI